MRMYDDAIVMENRKILKIGTWENLKSKEKFVSD